MRSNKKIALVITIFSLMFASCEKTFNTVINIDVPHTPMIAMTLSNMTIDNYIKGAITETRKITGAPQGTSSLMNAKAYIYEDGILKDSLAYFNVEDIFLSHQNNWIANKMYKVVISDLGKTTVDASDRMPELVTPSSVIRVKNAKSFTLPDYDNKPVMCDEITITFNDPPTPDNHYTVDFTKHDSFSGNYYSTNFICFDDDVETDYDDDADPTATTSMKYGTLYMNDDQFNGMTKKVVVYIPRYDFQSNDTINLQFNHISDNYYKYVRTLNRYMNAEGNPFSEPVQVFSNVNYGAGIFALQQRLHYILD